MNNRESLSRALGAGRWALGAGRWARLLLFVLAATMLATSSIKAYKRIIKAVASVESEVVASRLDIASVRSEVSLVKSGIASLNSEVASLKSEVASVRGFIPPLYGARHIEVRKFSILAQAAQVPRGFFLLAGDSIIEGLHLPRLNEVPVLNGGMGGGGIQAVSELLDDLPADAHVIGFVNAVGVNDAVIRTASPDYLKQWEKTYRAVVTKAKGRTEGVVAISTIIPVEAGKPLGDQYFDPVLIENMNMIIRKVSIDLRVTLIDNSKAFGRLREEKKVYTVDGVHLSRTSRNQTSNTMPRHG